jgi:hypothetical protein
MGEFAYLTAAQAGALVDRIGVGDSGNVPFGVPNRSGATVDIMEGDSVLAREARDRFVLRTNDEGASNRTMRDVVSSTAGKRSMTSDSVVQAHETINSSSTVAQLVRADASYA